MSEQWADSIRAARDARIAAVAMATAAEEQTIRAAAASGASPSEIARELGVQDRTRIYRILKQVGDQATVNPPRAPITVWLRGRGNSERTWDQVKCAMWLRGYLTVQDENAAFHRQRSGMTTVLADFSIGDVDGRVVGVWTVRARYRNDRDDGVPDDMLSGDDYHQIVPIKGDTRTRPERLDDTVRNKGGQFGAYVLDVDAFADMVAGVLD
jgi:hypothetical protein